MTKDYQPLGMPVSSSGGRSTASSATGSEANPVDARATTRARRLHAEAAVWIVRIDAGRATPGDARLARWCARSPQHRAAFDAALGQWQQADALRTRSATPPQRTPRARAASIFSFGFSAPRLAFACACAVAAIGITHYLHEADFATSAGELRTVALDDGSVMRLDADSAVDVRYNAHERRVVLERGRAAFDVKHGDARRFIVQAAEGNIADIGTAFQVSLPDAASSKHSTATLVTVTQGRVEVGNASGALQATAGQSIQYSDAAHAPASVPVDTFAATAWQRGRLVFTDTPLAEVAAALNRYWKGHFIYVRGNAATLRVSGNFAIDAPAQALATLAETLSLRATQIAGRVVILSAQDVSTAQ
ncbi:DUF4880 domain-containing protein [Paraburkholderia sp. Ac-20340]|uniref:FecR family protein n=1 Tax=Paraburkholderia sp. Ac-20340 TaxID=2703888 RepID=UPI00198224E2|nr:FecR domain-containing protein [Paraburkholderia sp. Ac-20340]MBN3857112.1 DUF4880 domain-containing protein [Paraburkholderia sp. Ac-20340]